MTSALSESSRDLLLNVDRVRQESNKTLDPARRSELGQFFTPAATARLMASMARALGDSIRILDPGAGVGSLTAALVAELCSRAEKPREVALTAYELDETLLPALKGTLEECKVLCESVGIDCSFTLRHGDFIEAGVEALDGGLFDTARPVFDLAILNPPYKKFRSDSRPRQLLRRLGVETSNLYTAFLSLVVPLLAEGGELIAITPRSFCNGPYFRPFRQSLLRSTSLARMHVFESRNHAFREDDVLQENVIFHAIRGVPQQDSVVVSESSFPDDPSIRTRVVPFGRVVQPTDAESFIHLVADECGGAVSEEMRALPCSLKDIGLRASTGRVVDFRARHWLRDVAGPETVPLIYPGHFVDGYVAWPKPESRKPNAIVRESSSESLLVASGIYVLVKRFSSKEERRRVVAAIFDPDMVPGTAVGFENHLNYFHFAGGPIERALAVGLAGFLNSSQLDTYFRQFNGHTQVNATDLRALRYPTRASLVRLGESIGTTFPDQISLDRLVAPILEGEKA